MWGSDSRSRIRLSKSSNFQYIFFSKGIKCEIGWRVAYSRKYKKRNMFTFIAAFTILTIRVILTALDEWIFAVRIGDKIRLNEPAPPVQNVMCSHRILFPKFFLWNRLSGILGELHWKSPMQGRKAYFKSNLLYMENGLISP